MPKRRLPLLSGTWARGTVLSAFQLNFLPRFAGASPKQLPCFALLSLKHALFLSFLPQEVLCDWDVPHFNAAYAVLPPIATSHRGAVRIWVRRDLGVSVKRTACAGPAVIAHLVGGPVGDRGVVVATCHLAPFKGNEAARMNQVHLRLSRKSIVLSCKR